MTALKQNIMQIYFCFFTLWQKELALLELHYRSFPPPPIIKGTLKLSRLVHLSSTCLFNTEIKMKMDGQTNFPPPPIINGSC